MDWSQFGRVRSIQLDADEFGLHLTKSAENIGRELYEIRRIYIEFELISKPVLGPGWVKKTSLEWVLVVVNKMRTLYKTKTYNQKYKFNEQKVLLFRFSCVGTNAI